MSNTTTTPYGLVMYCWFPDSDQPHCPGPKYRPVILLDIDSSTNHVKVAYGTSQCTEHFGLGEFVIKQDALEGLTMETKFCLTKAKWLPFTDAYFAKCGDKHILGMLPSHYFGKFYIAATEAQGR